MVNLTTLGAFRCFGSNGEIPSLRLQRMRAALLLYVALERDAPRDALLALFWPDRETARGRHALSQTLYELRGVLGADCILTEGDRVTASGALTTDAAAFLEAVEAGRLEDALALYGGPFLAGEHLSVTHGYESWVSRQRIRLSRAHVRARLEAIQAALDAGAGARAVGLARAGVEIDPGEDELQHRLIQLLLENGERGAAMQHYAAYETLLKSDGLEPLEETKALLEQARQAQRPARPVPAGKTAAAPAAPLPTPPLSTPPAPSPTQATRPPSEAMRMPHGRRRWAVAAVVVAIAAAAGAALLSWNRADPTADPDPLAIAVLPFANQLAPGRTPMDGRLAAYLLGEAFSRWTDIRLVDPLLVNDGLQQMAGGEDRPLDLRAALELGRRLGAGRIVVGDVWGVGDSLRVQAYIYDTRRRGAAASEGVARLDMALGSLAPLDSLADLLLAGGRGAGELSALGHTNSLSALEAFRGAEEALAAWDLRAAAEGYEAATRHDTAFAHAYLRLAQTLAWQHDTSFVWRAAAARAGALAGRMNARDQALSRAMAALAQQRYPEACRAYAEALAIDSLGFAAWYGLGDCNAWDPLVVADANSPSGWAFRSSYNAATNAYYRAVALVPSFNFAARTAGSARLASKLFVNPRRVRTGVVGGAEPRRFQALPALEGDTLAFVPYLLEDVRARRPGTRPATHAAAIEHNRAVLVDVTSRWVAAFPNSADALEALASALEVTGRIRSGAGPTASALDANARARSLATGEAQQFRLAIGRTRLLVKTRAFEATRALADSILDANLDAGAARAEALAGLASLVGRLHLSADLLARAEIGSDAVRQPAPPAALLESAARLLVYAAAGQPADSIRAMSERSLRLLNSQVPAARRGQVRIEHIDRGLALAFPVLGPSDAHRAASNGWPALIEMQSQLARGDIDAVRRALAADDSLESRYLPDYQAVDFVHQKALLRLAVGDTSTAIRQLARLLDNLELATTGAIDVPEAASLVQCMRLRAALTASDGAGYDWGEAAAALWRHADTVPARGAMNPRPAESITPSPEEYHGSTTA